MSRLSWNEIRARAAGFAHEWRNAHYEKGESQTFYNEFFEVFGKSRKSLGRYEDHVKRLDNTSGYIDLFWPGVLIVEQKSAGKNLADAYDQAGGYFDALEEWEQPHYILVSDFQRFELHVLAERRIERFVLADLPQRVEHFGFILGQRRRVPDEQDPVNLRSASLMGSIHDTLKESGYTGHNLERLLVRLAFCLFADDTGVFEPRDIFLELIETRTSVDGSDLGQWLAQLFEVLNTPDNNRSALLDEDLDQFPYVNGDLFRKTLGFASFNAELREQILEACRFDWSAISPAIFGALFQSVMDAKKRRELGAHYTTEANILKVIRPLFLDGLRDEFERLRKRRDTHRTTLLRRFWEELGNMRIFDPAAGCGNFLVISYRELRLLELEVIREINKSTRRTGQRVLGMELLSKVDVDQFYGIELEEFPARIAETALWMTDQMMNTQLGLEFAEVYTRIPLEKSPHIRHGDALEIDWAEMLAPEDCTVILGNPPYAGSKVQTGKQRQQMTDILAPTGHSRGTLDYVTAWFVKAGQYIQRNPRVRIGFVATNSITQGEQAHQLWPVLHDQLGLEISYAHSTFKWNSEAPKKAQVHVVILGLNHHTNMPEKKLLFEYPTVKGDPVETTASVISPYLFDASGMPDPHLTVASIKAPLNGMPPLKSGSKPIDSGIYIFKNAEDRTAFLQAEPAAEPFIRPYIGAKEFLHDKKRWILYLDGIKSGQIANMPEVKDRIRRVGEYRAKSRSEDTRELHPTKYHVNVVPDRPFLAIPEVSSENRDYIPIGWLEPPTIPSNLLRALEGATLSDFALLTSRMHMAWMRHIGGRLKSDFRYSIGVVYNTFPLPPGFHAPSTRAKLEPLAQQVLEARKPDDENDREEPLAYLYDRVGMPDKLLKAHRKLDRAVDRLYRPAGFNTDTQRIHHLLELYKQTIRPLG